MTSLAATVADWSEVFRLATFQGGLNATTVTVGTLLLGIAAGVVGVFALLRRRSLVADALSHATLPGLVIAFVAAVALGGDGRSLPVLLAGATASGVLGVLAIQGIGRWTRLREDAAIAIVLSVFFGAGIVGLSWIQANSSSSAAGIDHFIYGRTASMLPSDAITMAVLAFVTVVAAILFRREFGLNCFDRGFARSTGWKTDLLDIGILGLVVTVTVAGIQAVGIVLVVAMLVIPPVSARLWTDRLWILLILSGGLGGAGGWFGAVVSASLPDSPAGAVIVLSMGAIFVVSLLLAPRRGVVGVAASRLAMRLRMEADHLLEAMWELEAEESDPAPFDRERFDSMASERGWSRVFRLALVAMLRINRRIVRTRDARFVATQRGRRRGATVARNHRLWERYLVLHADVAASHVDWAVDQVEHVLSPELVATLERTLRDEGIDLPAAERGGVG